MAINIEDMTFEIGPKTGCLTRNIHKQTTSKKLNKPQVTHYTHSTMLWRVYTNLSFCLFLVSQHNLHIVGSTQIDWQMAVLVSSKHICPHSLLNSTRIQLGHDTVNFSHVLLTEVLVVVQLLAEVSHTKNKDHLKRAQVAAS